MSDNQTRDLVKRAYPTRTWAEKVDKMRPDQLAAVYIRLKANRKL